jgi:hypothetical protein
LDEWNIIVTEVFLFVDFVLLVLVLDLLVRLRVEHVRNPQMRL